MPRRPHAIATLACAFAVLFCRAQTPKASVPAQDVTVLHSNSNLVLLDVVVTERDKAVHGLDRQRFHVFEDGNQQKIASFEEHAPAAAPLPEARPAALPPHVFSNVPQYPEASAINVLLLDALNTPMADQVNVRQQMIQFMGTIAPGTPLAIFTLSSKLRLVAGFTTDTAALAKALQSPLAGAQRSVLPDAKGSDADEADHLMDNLIGEIDATGKDPVVIARMRQAEADVAAYQTDERVQMTLGAMQQLARYLSAMPGRKNLIWFSGSFPLDLAADPSQLRPFDAARNYSAAMKETSEMLSTARVAVYPVDARSLMSMSTYGASYTQSTKLGGKQTTPPSGNGIANYGASRTGETTPNSDTAQSVQYTLETQDSMRQIAQETGGKEYVNTNGLKEAVANAIDNGSSYYTLSFVPSAKKLDGQFHKVTVKVDNGDYKLAYRNGYFADPPKRFSAHNPAQVSQFTAATLHGAPPATQILFQAHVLDATDLSLHDAQLPAGPAGDLTKTLKGPLRRCVVDLNVDPRGLTYSDAPDGGHETQIEFFLVAYDADGNHVNYFDQSFQLQLDATRFAQVFASGIPRRVALDLPAGRYDLRIAVHDLASGNIGSLEVPVTVAMK